MTNRDRDVRRAHAAAQDKPTSSDNAIGKHDSPDLARRHVLAALAGGASMAAAQTAYADQPWWQEVLQKSRRQRAAKPAAKAASRAPQIADDLRPGKTPWRSDVMLEAMDKAIGRYETMAREKVWPKIGRGRLLRVGDHDERIPIIRRRLYLGGELPERGYQAYRSDYVYDEWLDAAVRRFQAGHGLRVSGFINRSTTAQLNVSPRDRLGQLQVNRRRLQALMNSRIEDRYVLVNAAAFQLEAVEKYEVAQRHRVIVGKPDRQTPEISAMIRGLNFFPYWRVPKSVAVKDLFPRLAKDLSYLDEHHIKVVRGYYDGPEIDPTAIDWTAADPKEIKFKQDPGPWNALGLVRIDMPNPDIVYMHDTPLKELFSSRGRAFSAGCVRVQDVMRLVGWIAKYEPGFEEPEARIDDIIAAGEAVDVKLTRPIPVYFAYITAWAEPDGTAVFRPDVYGRDGSAALRGEDDPDVPPPPAMLSP